MRALFYLGLLGLVAFEIANVYFIMPMPGSQRMRSLDAAYALYHWRWVLRGVFAAMLLAGFRAAWNVPGWWRVWVPLTLLVAGAITYVTNFQMAADRMFRQPTRLVMVSAGENHVAMDRLVVGVEVDGEASAYPIQFIGYHHQVRDTVGGHEVLVSYCTVCRTGRVFEPRVAGASELFRLVGMDHFNAMFEDQTTKSWWRQANGEAVAGPLKGTVLAEVPSLQVTLRQWLALHPGSRIMQADPAFLDAYARDYAFERGSRRGGLTGTDPQSWQEKSWVVGLRVGDSERAYDWSQLQRERAINDTLGGLPVVLAITSDSLSFFAFVRPDTATRFEVSGDSLRAADRAYDFSGRGSGATLNALLASQEFWHSWRSFHPRTTRYE